MTNVHVKLYEGDGTTLATGYVLATPTTRRDVTDGIALPVGKAYPLVAGEATMVLAPWGDDPVLIDAVVRCAAGALGPD